MIVALRRRMRSLLAALGALVVQLSISMRHRKQNRVPAGDPWDGRSLEWAVRRHRLNTNLHYCPS